MQYEEITLWQALSTQENTGFDTSPPSGAINTSTGVPGANPLIQAAVMCTEVMLLPVIEHQLISLDIDH